ncbi:MAG TPA: MgtC/SapB family protein [Kofleriaceae bacterium]|nr:MgtC/SapB family protein [Kofleriaceae bacterium]
MEPYETHIALATALAVGLLVGLEREQSKPERPGSALGGMRTYPIIALIGALATLLGPTSMWLPLIALGGVFALVAISYAVDVRRDRDHGATTEVSVIATYLLGALAASRGVIEPMSERLVLVAGLGVVLTFLLSSKRWFHRFAARVSREDFFATVKFLIVAVIVLPLLPDRAIGPFGGINPRHLGILVVTISGLSFAGYIGMRLLGARRGVLLGGALGGLVSSTAATLSFATRTRQEPKLAPVAAGGIAVAWTIMLGRVGVLVAIVHPPLVRALALPLGAMVVAALIGLALTFRRAEVAPGELELENPFELGRAIKVTLAFGVVLFASKAATAYFGDRALYLAAAIAGITDVDAITVSSAQLAGGGLDAVTATVGIAIAIAVNTVVKAGLAMTVGGAALGRRTAVVGALIIAGGAAGLAAGAGLGLR